MASDDLNLYSNDNVREYIKEKKIDLFLSDEEIKGIYINIEGEDSRSADKEILYNSYLDFIKKFSTPMQSVLGTITNSAKEREELKEGTKGQGGFRGYESYTNYLQSLLRDDKFSPFVLTYLFRLGARMRNHSTIQNYQDSCVRAFIASILYGMPNEVFLQPFLNTEQEICRGCGIKEPTTDECDICDEGYTRCEMECDDGTIYCNECENGYIDCEECDNDGEVQCGECDGTGELQCPQENLGVCQDGEVECDECNGMGKNDDGEECDECDGRGKTTCDECDGDEVVDCDNCNNGYVTCGQCDGDGSFECELCEYDGYSYCQNCEEDGYNTCVECDGEWEATLCTKHEVVTFVPKQLKPFVEYINRPQRILHKAKIKVEMVREYETWVKKMASFNGKNILAIGLSLENWNDDQEGNERILTMKCDCLVVNFEEPSNNYKVSIGFNKNDDDYKGYIHSYYEGRPRFSYYAQKSNNFLILTIPYGLNQGFMNWDVLPF